MINRDEWYNLTDMKRNYKPGMFLLKTVGFLLSSCNFVMLTSMLCSLLKIFGVAQSCGFVDITWFLVYCLADNRFSSMQVMFGNGLNGFCHDMVV